MTVGQPAEGNATTASAEVELAREPTEIERAENVKHLELIQAIITRLATNSFFIKGWTLTVVAAAFGFAVNRVDWRIAIAGSIITAGFWLLDAYYLRQERLFRHLYNHVRRNVSRSMNDRFSMNLVPYAGYDTTRRFKVVFSATLIMFYPLLAAIGILVTIVFSLAGAAPGAPPVVGPSVSVTPSGVPTLSPRPSTTEPSLSPSVPARSPTPTH